MEDLNGLIDALNDAGTYIRRQAAGRLTQAAIHGQDISAAIPALAQALLDTDRLIAEQAVDALCEASLNGADITMAVPGLVSELKNRMAWPRQRATRALSCHYLRQNEWGEIGQLLANPDYHIQKGVRHTLHDFHPTFDSLTELERFGQNTERFFQEWRAKQPQGVTAEKITMQQDVSELLTRVAMQKSGLTRKRDGELLAGETISTPTRKGELYSLVQRGRSHV